ncbi:MAG: hypothetical protein L6R39_007415, partial [Caloplaca ligustica]
MAINIEAGWPFRLYPDPTSHLVTSLLDKSDAKASQNRDSIFDFFNLLRERKDFFRAMHATSEPRMKELYHYRVQTMEALRKKA